MSTNTMRVCTRSVTRVGKSKVYLGDSGYIGLDGVVMSTGELAWTCGVGQPGGPCIWVRFLSFKEKEAVEVLFVCFSGKITS